MPRQVVHKILNDQRKCILCQEVKPLSDFKFSPAKKHYKAKCVGCEAALRKDYWSRPEKRFLKYKNEASRRGYSFDLKLEEFLSFASEPCHYCGIKLDRIRLDRVDNQQGYSFANVVSCCKTCNYLKGSHDKDKFLQQVFKISAWLQK